MSKIHKFVTIMKGMKPSDLKDKHYCILFSGKRIIRSGVNKMGNHSCGYEVPSIHAEMDVLNYIHKHKGIHRRWERFNRDPNDQWSLE